mmetsp:Transcript_18040/g.45134  ORF Transcript_18040/g.45134 Transcript_18040/m.45134 type:complete len:227 (-) Transcript_18040:655-1335(-)|eukprot:CAMPEP_0178986092 /NCGR_PEP_ID=MMETSP0795-20121207/2513_1 /TAXON_ID=88552 /ORGANISM="Amoebophrya sp., Strain Ameob2" /LENGTH=226 /DNA_ID=CAMNT_0020677117 /DNA_START=207 /DNA_END=887 /DNA_ORIENTATION=+
MVIPLPAIGVSPTPSRCALLSRPYLFVLIVLLFARAVQEFVMLDILGGFVTMLLAAIGLFVLRDGSVDMHCLVTWGMVCFLQGVFAVVILIDRAVKPGRPPFFTADASKMPEGMTLARWNSVSAISLLGILALYGIAVVALIVYNKTMAELEENFAAGENSATQPIYGQGAQQRPGGNGTGGQDPASYGTDGTPLAPPASTHFTPFSGAGNRVGGDGEDSNEETRR